MDFELHPLGQSGGDGEAARRTASSAFIAPLVLGSRRYFLRVNEFEDVGEGILLAGQIGAAQGDGDDFRAAGGEGVAHGFRGGEFAGAENQAGRKGFPAMTSGWLCNDIRR
jgi:hypothetical protein